MQVVRPEVRPKAIVNMGSSAEKCAFLAQSLDGGHRPSVGVLNDCGDPICRRRGGAARKVLSRGIPRLHEVYVGVDHAGEDE
jgi:hypothetical protein